MNTHKVTVNGTVNPTGAETTAQIEYGTDLSYGNVLDLPVIPVGFADVPISIDITGLEPQTEYHVILVAVNSEGSAQTEDKTFTTPADVNVAGIPVVKLGEFTNLI